MTGAILAPAFRLKVYSGNLDGRREAVAAFRSLHAFCAASGISRDYACETGNAEDVAQAMTAPGTVFVRPINARSGAVWEVYRPAAPAQHEGGGNG